MPDGHSRVEPPLPIPNRTVKRPCADDSAVTGVKVGHCQATYTKAPYHYIGTGLFCILDIQRVPVIASDMLPPYHYLYI